LTAAAELSTRTAPNADLLAQCTPDIARSETATYRRLCTLIAVASIIARSRFSGRIFVDESGTPVLSSFDVQPARRLAIGVQFGQAVLRHEDAI